MHKTLLIAAVAAGFMVGQATGQVQTPPQTVQSRTKTTVPKQSVATPKAAAAKAGSPGVTSEQDKQIEEKIRAKLAKSKIGKDGMTVRVQGGTAFWEGTTTVVQHKGSATRMAKAAGARTVVNNIKVADAAKEKAAKNLEDGRRRAQVTRSEPRKQQ